MSQKGKKNYKGKNKHTKKDKVEVNNVMDQLYDEIGKGNVNGVKLSESKFLPDSVKQQFKELDEKAEEELMSKLLNMKLDGNKTGGTGDGDQSPLKGDEAQILRAQWSGGMGYTPLDSQNHSSWLQALWCGDYVKTMSFLDNKSSKAVKRQLDSRESLLNVCGIFHVIIGARTLCGDNPYFQGIQKALISLKGMMDNFEHIKILKKLLELGANVEVKDVAGYTPLHHCLTAVGNTETFIMAELLLEAGANPNQQNRFGCTPMFEPLMNGKLDFVSLLLKFGGYPGIEDNDGVSCLTLGHSFPKVMKLFGAASKTLIEDERKQLTEAAGGSLRKCQQCEKAGEDPKRCTGCYLALYCGLDCQKKAWPGHRKECKVTRKQYKRVLLHDYDIQCMDYTSGGKRRVHKKGEKPSKSHFVVKIQVPVPRLQLEDAETKRKSGLLVYNEERTICGKIRRVPGQNEVIDEIVERIKKDGWQGQKGYFYCILQEVGMENDVGYVLLDVNTSKVLPPETW